MKKIHKLIIAGAFVLLLLAAGVFAAVLNRRPVSQGEKTFRVEVISQRDNYDEITECHSDAEYLGEFLRTFEPCQWQEGQYGIYITGFSGMEEDVDDQYWWNVAVNGESSMTGADEIPLAEGDVYTFTLMQGW